jgi:hypothetical protein
MIAHSVTIISEPKSHEINLREPHDEGGNVGTPHDEGGNVGTRCRYLQPLMIPHYCVYSHSMLDYPLRLHHPNLL